MDAKKWIVFALAAVFAAAVLAGCNWWTEEEGESSSGSSSSTGNSSSRPSCDEDEWEEPVMYTVTIEAGPNGTAVVSTNCVEEGGSVLITAYPEAGYEVETVTANGKPLTAGRDGIYAIFNITENQKITVTFDKKGIVTAADRAFIRQELDELLNSEELKEYKIQPFALNDTDAAFLEDWFRKNGYGDVFSDSFSKTETAAEAEAYFGVNFYNSYSTSDENPWKKEDEKAWMLYEAASMTYQKWTEGDIDGAIIWDTVLKAMLTYWDEDGNDVPLSGDFSIAFVIVEDQEEQEVHVLWIIQRVPENAAARRD